MKALWKGNAGVSPTFLEQEQTKAISGLFCFALFCFYKENNRDGEAAQFSHRRGADLWLAGVQPSHSLIRMTGPALFSPTDFCFLEMINISILVILLIFCHEFFVQGCFLGRRK